jgi:hypothetical protein
MNTVDTVNDLQGIAVNESNKSVRPLCLADGVSGTNNIRMDILYDNNTSYYLRVFTATNWGENTYKVYSTLKYTKTADTAISIGEATEYSTDEKVVGTWIDGKHVYQKTIDCGALPNNATKVVSIPANIDTIVSVSGIASRNGAILTLPRSYTNTTYNIDVSISTSNN